MKISNWTKGVILTVFTITVFIIGAFIYRNTLESESEATFSDELTIEELMPTIFNYSSDVVDKDTVFLAYSFDLYADKNFFTKSGITIIGSGETTFYNHTPDFIVLVTLNSTEDTIYYNNEIYVKQ